MNDNEPLDERKPAKTEIRGGDKPSDYIPHEKQSGKPLVHGKDWDYTPVTVPPSEAQFIDDFPEPED